MHEHTLLHLLLIASSSDQDKVDVRQELFFIYLLFN